MVGDELIELRIVPDHADSPVLLPAQTNHSCVLEKVKVPTCAGAEKTRKNLLSRIPGESYWPDGATGNAPQPNRDVERKLGK
jgi:hypothetical protein